MRRIRWRGLLSVALVSAMLATAPGHVASADALALDMTPPSLTLLKPADGSTVRGQVLIEASADDGTLGSGVRSVEYQLNSTVGPWTAMTRDLLVGTYKANWATDSFADGSYNLYVRATDNAANTSVVSVVITVANPPAAPTGLKVTPPSPPSNGGYLDLYWNPNLESDLAGYNIYRSQAAGGPFVKVYTAVTNAFRDGNLTNGTTYYYVVSAVDAAGNESPRTGTAFGTPTDTKSPAVANVAASNISPTSADITWTTDEPASSQVEYGTGGTLGSATPVDATLVTAHRIALSGLRPATTYSYRVRSADAAGNATTSAILTFTTAVDKPPVVSFVSPADGSFVQGVITLKVSATDDWGLTAVEYSTDGFAWKPLAYNSFSGYYEASVDTVAVGEGARQIGARATDTGGQTTQAVIGVTVDNQAPSVSVVYPDPANHILSGTLVTLKAQASDAGSGVAGVDEQIYLVPFGVLHAVPPDPDPAAWKPMALNPQSGLWEAPYQAPLIVTERMGWAYMRATDRSGKSTTAIAQVAIAPNGRAFSFATASGGTLSGMVTIEPIGTAKPNRIGVDMRGRGLQPGATYTLTIRGVGETITVSVTIDGRGRGVTAFEADTDLADEFALDLSASGPGF